MLCIPCNGLFYEHKFEEDTLAQSCCGAYEVFTKTSFGSNRLFSSYVRLHIDWGELLGELTKGDLCHVVIGGTGGPSKKRRPPRQKSVRTASKSNNNQPPSPLNSNRAQTRSAGPNGERIVKAEPLTLSLLRGSLGGHWVILSLNHLNAHKKLRT